MEKQWRLQMTDKAEIMESLALANELLNKLKEIEALGGNLANLKQVNDEAGLVINKLRTLISSAKELGDEATVRWKV
jgi:hypothetical protein